MDAVQATLFDTLTVTPDPEPMAVVVVDADYYRAHSREYTWRCWEANKGEPLPSESALRDWFHGLYGHEPDAVLVLPDMPYIAWCGPVRGRG